MAKSKLQIDIENGLYDAEREHKQLIVQQKAVDIRIEMKLKEIDMLRDLLKKE